MRPVVGHRSRDRWLTERMTVVVCGPATWNHLIELDRLPEPTPHMQFATGSVRTVGGTSAGKAVHLAELGLDVRLHALLGADAEGAAVASGLARAGVRLARHASEATEQHVNLMTRAGERVSLYVATPSAADPAIVAEIGDDLDSAAVAVVDLSALGAELVARGIDAPVWTDLHDYDGKAAFHEPFLRAAEVVFMNDDAVDDPWQLLESCLQRGPRLAVCTRGASGAIAMDAARRRYAVAAVEVDVVDSNGAGDAFFAGFLAAHGAGSDVEASLEAGARQAAVALASPHLHPALSEPDAGTRAG